MTKMGAEYPIPESLLPHIRFAETLHDIRKLHYIFAEDDALVGIYVVREHPGGDSMHINGHWAYMDGYIQDTMYYVHQDRLGSYAVITDDTGQVRQRLGYDVWGNRVLDTNWAIARHILGIVPI